MKHDETVQGLTPDIEKKILRYAAQGLSGRKIAEQPDVPVSQVTVNRFLRDHRRDRAETTKAIVREHLSATLPTDLEMLDRLTARLEVMRQAAEAAGEDADPDEARKARNQELLIVDRQVKTIGLKLKYSGADEDDSVQRLLDALSGDNED